MIGRALRHCLAMLGHPVPAALAVVNDHGAG